MTVEWSVFRFTVYSYASLALVLGFWAERGWALEGTGWRGLDYCINDTGRKANESTTLILMMLAVPFVNVHRCW